MHVLQNISNCHQIQFQIQVMRFQEFSPNRNLTEKSLSERIIIFYLSNANITKQNFCMNWHIPQTNKQRGIQITMDIFYTNVPQLPLAADLSFLPPQYGRNQAHSCVHYNPLHQRGILGTQKKDQIKKTISEYAPSI